MTRFLIKWIIGAVALMAVVHLVSGIEATNWASVLIAALILGFLNAFLKPFLIFITLPLNILSLGIFTFFINAFLLYIVSKLVKGLFIAGFWSAFWGAFLFSIISFLLNIFIKTSFGIAAVSIPPPSSPPAGSRKIIDAEIVEKDDRKK